MIIEKIIEKNPMAVELLGLARRFVPKNWKFSFDFTMVMITGFVLLIGALLGAIAYQMPSHIAIIIAMAILPFAVGGLTFGTIAGERQARTLDLLLASPLTTSQIVKGKALRALLPIALLFLIAFSFAIAFDLGQTARVLFYPPMYYVPNFSDFSPMYMYAPVMAVIFLATGWNMVGLAMMISSMSKTSNASLLSFIGSLITLYVVLPSVGGVVVSQLIDDIEKPLAILPLVASLYFMQQNPPSGEWSEYLVWAMVGVLLSIVLGFLQMKVASVNVARLKEQEGEG